MNPLFWLALSFCAINNAHIQAMLFNLWPIGSSGTKRGNGADISIRDQKCSTLYRDKVLQTSWDACHHGHMHAWHNGSLAQNQRHFCPWNDIQPHLRPHGRMHALMHARTTQIHGGLQNKTNMHIPTKAFGHSYNQIAGQKIREKNKSNGRKDWLIAELMAERSQSQWWWRSTSLLPKPDACAIKLMHYVMYIPMQTKPCK